MVKRRSPIGINFNRVDLSTPSFIRNDLVPYETILNNIQRLKDKYNAEAYNNYNSSQYSPIKVSTEEPEDFDIQVVNKRNKNTSYKYNKSSDKFINDIYNSYYKSVRPGATSDEDAIRQATYLTQKAALETGYGTHIANTHNYGGHKNKLGWLAFNSMDDFTKRDVALLDKKWKNWRTAKNESQFIDAINTNNGYGQYAPPSENINYKGKYMGLSKRVNTILANRPKAWVGAVIGSAIGTAGNILGSIFSSNAQKRQAEEQKRLMEHENAVASAANLSQALGLTQAAQKKYEDRFRVNYKYGGRRSLKNGVNITDGGYDVPIGHNTFLLRGGSHEDINETGQTGIGIKVGNKEVEAENGEVVQKTPNEVRIFSDSIGIDGYSFADLVKMGYDKDELFKIQQTMNGDYGIGNKRRLRNGGSVSRPVERIKAEWGLKQILKDAYNWTADKWRAFEDATTLESVKNNPYVQSGIVIAPNRVGANPAAIARGINATRRLANSVRNTFYRTVPKTVTKNPRVVTAPKGSLNNVTRSEARAYRWPRNSAPNMNAENYAGATISRGFVNGSDLAEGSINFSLADRLRMNAKLLSDAYKEMPSNVKTTAKIAGWAAGLGTIGTGLYLISDDNNKETLNTTSVNNKRRINNAVRDSSNVQTNIADSVRVITPDSLTTDSVTVQPTVDSTTVGSNTISTRPASTTQPSRGATISTRPARRRLASRGVAPASTTTTPASTTITVPPTATPEQELEYIQNVMRSNGVSQTDNNTYTNPVEQTLREFQSNPTINYNDRSNVMPPVNNNNTNRMGATFKTADYIQLGADALGSIVSGIISSNTANSIEDPSNPVLLTPGKLITNYNIAPRLAEISETRNRMLRDTDEGVSSAARLDRRNAINIASNTEANKLWGEKTNQEVALLNQDTLNQQGVHGQNVALLNDYYNRLTEARNRRSLLEHQGRSSMYSGLIDAVGNFLDQGKQRYSDEQAMRYYMALLPESGREWLRRNRVDLLKNGGRIR